MLFAAQDLPVNFCVTYTYPLFMDRFLVRNTGFTTLKSPDVSLTHDKGALLPPSTKASSEDSGDLNSSGVSGGGLQMSARVLPPIYVDIQEEIEANLDEINKLSKSSLSQN